ncbi:MAG: DUF2226 domain-containing protein [Candidatus Methanofastidiosia archaeon]
MKIPKGKRLKEYSLREISLRKIFEEIFSSEISGYLRITLDVSGLNDFYSFVRNGRVFGFYGEEMLKKRNQIFGEEAFERLKSFESKCVVDIVEISDKELSKLMRKFPEILLEKELKDASEIEKEVSIKDLLENTLKKINKAGEFKSLALLDEKGFPIASLGCEEKTIKKLHPLAKDVKGRAESQIGLSDIDEISMVDSKRLRLVFRNFSIKDKKFLLAVILDAHLPYRMLTNKAMRVIEEILLMR